MSWLVWAPVEVASPRPVGRTAGSGGRLAGDPARFAAAVVPSWPTRYRGAGAGAALSAAVGSSADPSSSAQYRRSMLSSAVGSGYQPRRGPLARPRPASSRCRVLHGGTGALSSRTRSFPATSSLLPQAMPYPRLPIIEATISKWTSRGLTGDRSSSQVRAPSMSTLISERSRLLYAETRWWP